MPAGTETKSKAKTGCYVYGILPGDVELDAGVDGVGDPPGEIRLARSGDLAALVSEVDPAKPLGTPEDLQAHQDILDSVITSSPVLPLRFGAVLADEDAVVAELLEPNRDEFTAALEELDGRVEYVVKGRFAEQAILEEILSRDPEAAQLAAQIRGADADATRDLRIQLGELMNDAVTSEREQATRVLVNAVSDYAEASFVRDPTHELDAVHVAFLVEEDRAGKWRQEVEEVGGRWEGLVDLRILGPMAAYDFVGSEGQG
jgi:Gas vesicle synthesis protein GvpL/GvpF